MWEPDEDGEKLPPIHPGEFLKEDFLIPMEISEYRLAKSIGVDPRRINAIVHGKRAITAETAILFSQFFGTTAQFWMGIQNRYDLDVAMDKMGVSLAEFRNIPVVGPDEEGTAVDPRPNRQVATQAPAPAVTANQ